MLLQFSALANGLEQQRGGGGRDVERVNLASLGKRNEAIARGGDTRAQALALAAQDEHRGTCEIDLPRRLRGPSVGSPDPEARLRRLAEPVSQIADGGDRQVVCRSRRGLAGTSRRGALTPLRH